MAKKEIVTPGVYLMLPPEVGGPKPPKGDKKNRPSVPWARDADHLQLVEDAYDIARQVAPLLPWCDDKIIHVQPCRQADAKNGAGIYLTTYLRYSNMHISPVSNPGGVPSTLFEDVLHELAHIYLQPIEQVLYNTLDCHLTDHDNDRMPRKDMYQVIERGCFDFAMAAARMLPDLAARYNGLGKGAEGIPHALKAVV